jgi:hypothetical protein
VPDYYQLIKQQYQNTRGDSTELFNLILQASKEIGMDQALAYLEQCVIEKRLAWLKENRDDTTRADDPLMEGYRWFYERYLRVSVPADGEIIEHTSQRLVMRWRNHCPTLDACQKLGLDTREVCKKAYERPVEEFLKTIHPNLRFQRNYEHIRPHAAFCEEIIILEDQ